MTGTLITIRDARADGAATAHNHATDYARGTLTYTQLVARIRDYHGMKEHYPRTSPAWHYASAYLQELGHAVLAANGDQLFDLTRGTS